MADKDEGPSLELNLGFRRKKRTSPDPAPEPATEKAAAPTADEPQSVSSPPTAPTEPEPVEPSPVEPSPVEPSPVEPSPVEPSPVESRPREVHPDETAVLPLAPPEREPEPELEPEPEPAHREPKPKREFHLPALPGRAAAILTGVLIGLLTVGLTWLGEQLCQLVRNTTSCGGPGFFLILIILAVLGFLGGYLLHAWGVPDSRSTSFLGVGLLAVLAIVFLSSHLLEWWMAIAIPIIAAVSYAVSHAITTAIVDVEDDSHR